MIKLCKSDLVVLEKASDILTSLYYNSTEREKVLLDIATTQLSIDGIILYHEKMRKDKGE